MTSTIIKFRCTEAEKARWLEQAGSRTLTDYFKYLADRDSGAEALEFISTNVSEPTGHYVSPPITRESQASIARPTPVTAYKRDFKPDFKVPVVKKTPKGSANSTSSKKSR